MKILLKPVQYFLMMYLLMGFSLSAFAGSLDPLGVFESIKGDQDRLDGYRVFLWKEDKKLIGEMIYWYGEKEGIRKKISSGSFDTKNKKVNFTLSVKKKSLKPIKATVIKFDGFLRGNDLVGTMEVEDKQTKKITKESAFLIRNPNYYLKTFNNETEWRKNRQTSKVD